MAPLRLWQGFLVAVVIAGAIALFNRPRARRRISASRWRASRSTA